MARRLALLLVPLLLAGCGSDHPAKPAPAASHARYAPGDPDCDAAHRPGTVGTIGEDLAGGRVSVSDFIGCYGPPAAVKRQGARRCLFYATRGEPLYWEICAAGGRIVSAAGGRSKP